MNKKEQNVSNDDLVNEELKRIKLLKDIIQEVIPRLSVKSSLNKNINDLDIEISQEKYNSGGETINTSCTIGAYMPLSDKMDIGVNVGQTRTEKAGYCSAQNNINCGVKYSFQKTIPRK